MKTKTEDRPMSERESTLLSQRNELREALQAITDSYADILAAPMGSVPAAWETRARAILAQARAALANAKD